MQRPDKQAYGVEQAIVAWQAIGRKFKSVPAAIVVTRITGTASYLDWGS